MADRFPSLDEFDNGALRDMRWICLHELTDKIIQARQKPLEATHPTTSTSPPTFLHANAQPSARMLSNSLLLETTLRR
jgi:hypothetical protein